ncbi:MAG: DUF4351 domain-containing protein [Magnetococcales bacterium]|nr:DUF4351 domain-containing protein [Magnetococcales bacterium]
MVESTWGAGILEGRKEGIQIGRQEGRQDGIQIGERNTLLRLLTRRFGDLPAEVHAKVNAAEMDTLESWIDQVLDAHSLNDVLR